QALRDKWLRAPVDYGRYVIAAAWSAVALLVSAALLAAWILTLRRTVTARTAEAVSASEALREREAQLRSLGDNLPGGFVYQYEVADGQPRFRYVSAGIEDLLGVSPAAAMADARQVFASIPADGLARYTEAEARSTRDMSDFSVTLPFDLPDGRRRWFQIQSRPRRLPDGATVWDGVTLDVTDRIEASEQLERRVEERTAELAVATEAARRNSERLHAILDNANAGIVLILDRRIEQCNRRLEQMTGHDPGELDGRSTEVLYASRDEWVLAGREVRETLSAGKPYVREQLARRKDGTTFWVRVSSSAIDPTDLGKGIVGMMEDITQEHAVREEMTRARALAEEAVRTKAEFLANMSHEIRTPMNSVIGMTLLALKADPPPRVRDYLRKIQSSSQHLLGVINDILDFSKLESEKMMLEQVDFELDRMLDEVRALFAEKAAEKGLEWILDRRPECPPVVRGDPLRVRQVLINLIGNAIKFTEQGEIGLRVAVERLDDALAVLRFEIRDTGIGIPPSQLGQLFEGFRQADASTTRRFGGTGLGLAISRGLVGLMGGRIGVESAAGVGSTFWFTVPFGIGPPAATDAGKPALARASFRGLRALVVDDNASARDVIAEMLGSLGFEVSSTSAGAIALETIATADRDARPFDLVFLDWKMPGMDGLETARELQRRPLTRLPLVLMITAFDRDEVLSSARQLGIGEVLVKPVTPSMLFDAVQRCVGGGAGPRDAQPADALITVPALDGARALLVEDNVLNQEVAIEFLKAIGMTVDVAGDGAVALQRLRDQPYDIVLMDMQMPVMDGISATREIRRMPGFAQLPIVAMTANAMAGDRERCLAAGMNDHIAKPIDPQDLVAKLLRWVRPRGSVPGPVTAATSEHSETPGAPESPHAVTIEASSGSPGPGRQTGPIAGAPADPLERLRAIAGLDVATGLKLAADRPTLYLALLGKYLSGQSDALPRIGSAISEGRWEDAERAAHTLKGVSAQIGADAIRDTALRLERALRSIAGLQGAGAAIPPGPAMPPGDLAPLLTTLDRSLTPLLDAIREALGQPASGSPRAEADQEAWPRLRERLAALLADDDAGTGEFVDANEALIRQALGPAQQDFMDAVRNFDFPRALERLRQAG
ncbi:MAG: hypothetical protein RIS35_876, partial [Pseudomonadota bacterium]